MRVRVGASPLEELAMVVWRNRRAGFGHEGEGGDPQVEGFVVSK